MLSRSILARQLQRSCWSYGGSQQLARLILLSSPSLIAGQLNLGHGNGCALSTASAFSCQWQSAKAYATSSNNNDDEEYEIDLITLKKTPKKVNKSPPSESETDSGSDLDARSTTRSTTKIRSFEDISVDSIKFYPDQYRDENPFPYSFEGEEYESELDFVSQFNHEINTLLTFIQKSYSNKIKQFDQLTYIELSNCLYIFKNYYMNKKINSIKPNDVDSYNQMFDQFLSFLKSNHQFPSLLTQILIPKFNQRTRLVQLMQQDLHYFTEELDSLNKEFDFHCLNSVAQLSSHIDNTLTQFDQFAKYYLVPDPNYVKISLQIKRYKSLKAVLDANELNYTIDDLLLLIEDKHHVMFKNYDNYVPASVEFETIQEYWRLLNWKYDLGNHNPLTFVAIAPVLFEICQQNKDNNNSTFYHAAETILEYYVAHIGKGYYSFASADFELQSFPKVCNVKIYDIFKKYTQDDSEVYILSLLFDSDLPIENFRLLKYKGTIHGPPEEDIDQLTHDDLNCENHDNHFAFKQYFRDNEGINRVNDYNILSCVELIISTPELYKLFLGKTASTFDIHDTNIDDIPDEILIMPYLSALSEVRLVLFKNEPFANYSSDKIIAIITSGMDRYMALFDTNYEQDYDWGFKLEETQRMLYFLKEYFKLQPNQTSRLDILVDDQSETKERFISSLMEFEAECLNVSESPGFYKFYQELTSLKNHHFDAEDEVTVENFITQLQHLIDVSYDHFPAKFLAPLTKDNHYKYRELLEMLKSVYRLKLAEGSESVSVLNFGFEQMLSKLELFDHDDFRIWNSAEVNPTYVQIPDDLYLHQYYKELKAFEDEVLQTNYVDSNAKEILYVMEHKITQVYRNADKILVDEDYYPTINDSNVGDFVKLHKKLTQLFSINGGNTEVLDTLIHSQSAFQQFEESKAVPPEHVVPQEPSAVGNEYKQMPDDFFLEEYVIELIQLKEELNIREFKEVDSAVILNKLSELSNGDGSISKKIVWSKLFRNLSTLFKINGNQTFFLDNVLINGEEFIKFESKKSFNNVVSHHENSWIGENSKLINDNFNDIEELLTVSNLKNKDGIWKLSPNEFAQLLTNYISSYDKSSYNYPIVLNLVESLRNLNIKLDYYPNFLQQLYEIKSNNVNKRLSELDVEDIYKAFIEKLEYEEAKKSDINEEHGVEERIICPSSKAHVGIKPIYVKTNELDDAEIADLKAEYNDSEQLISNLIKSEDPVDLQRNEVLHTPVFPNEESIIKEALSSSVKDSASETSTMSYSQPPSPPTPLYKKFDITAQVEPNQDDNIRYQGEPQEEPQPMVVDKFSLEHFLKDAKTSSELEDERKFREDKAYEWSHSMCHSHRSLESHNFFDPLMAEQKHIGKAEFLLLTLEGQAISCDAESIGKLPKDDIFKFLNKFDNFELELVMRSLKRLQRSNWKLIGSKVEGDQKYLILSRTRPSTRRRILIRIKTFFASAGAVFLTLAGLNVWLGDSTVDGRRAQENSKAHNKIDALINQDAARVEVPVAGWAPGRPIKEDVVEKVPITTETELDNSTSYWKSLLWSGK